MPLAAEEWSGAAETASRSVYPRPVKHTNQTLRVKLRGEFYAKLMFGRFNITGSWKLGFCPPEITSRWKCRKNSPGLQAWRVSSGLCTERSTSHLVYFGSKRLKCQVDNNVSHSQEVEAEAERILQIPYRIHGYLKMFSWQLVLHFVFICAAQFAVSQAAAPAALLSELLKEAHSQELQGWMVNCRWADAT